MKSLLHKLGINYVDFKYRLLVTADPARLKAGLARLLEGSYRGELSREIIDCIPRLESAELAEDTVKELYEKAQNLASNGEFDQLIDPSLLSKMQSADICRCYGYHTQKRWKLQLFYMPKGTEHPPHAHHNLDSFLVVLRGKIWIKEFRREVSPNGKIKIIKANERNAGPNEGMVTTEFGNNVHHFGTEEDTVCLNFNLRGYNKRTFLEDHKGFGRRYLQYGEELKDGAEITYKYK